MSKNEEALRLRFKDKRNITKTYEEINEKSKVFLPLPSNYLLAVLGLALIVFTAVIVIEKQLPPGLKIAEEHRYPDRFIAERAYNHLRNLTSLGPRIAGSYVNEVLAIKLLKNEIQMIIDNAKKNNVIELDVQKVSGSFALKFLDGMTNVYSGLQNVVVRVGSHVDSLHSLLINCHFDTVVDSPGGSDDGAGCAVMLEILRVISQSDQTLRHNIIFLFNGGEENFLPASHGFITQHKWAKEVSAFINLEACGAGGREVLFQAGPNHPWILETYSEEVPYPYASSLAQEIFQSGVVPGDTDYRIFRDFGNLSGLDFAWSANGYVYHTKFDTIDQIPLGSLQRTGDNILSLARGMARGHQLSNIESHKAGNLVFFDFLGAFVVRWSMTVSNIINTLSVIFSIYTIMQNSKENRHVVSKDVYLKKLFNGMGAVVGTWFASALFSLIIAIGLNLLDRTMAWYGRPLWVFFLYMVPTTLVSQCVIYLHAKYNHKSDLASSCLSFLWHPTTTSESNLTARKALRAAWLSEMISTILMCMRRQFEMSSAQVWMAIISAWEMVGEAPRQKATPFRSSSLQIPMPVPVDAFSRHRRTNTTPIWSADVRYCSFAAGDIHAVSSREAKSGRDFICVYRQ